MSGAATIRAARRPRAADRDRSDRDFALLGAASGLGNRLGHQRQLSFAFDHPEQCYIDKVVAPNREFARIRSSSATAGHPLGIKTVKNGKMEIGEILPQELSERLKRGERPIIVHRKERKQ